MAVRVGGLGDVIDLAVVRIGEIAQAVDDLPLLGEVGQLGDVVAEPRQFRCVTMKMRKILRDHFAVGVVPGTGADAVARVHGRLAGPRLRTEVSMPRAISGAGGSCQRLAMCVGAGQSAEVASVADRFAGHEKIHHRRRLHAPRIFARPLHLREQQAAGEDDHGGKHQR